MEERKIKTNSYTFPNFLSRVTLNSVNIPLNERMNSPPSTPQGEARRRAIRRGCINLLYLLHLPVSL